jgi:hypothetical protein
MKILTALLHFSKCGSRFHNVGFAPQLCLQHEILLDSIQELVIVAGRKMRRQYPALALSLGVPAL